MALNPAKINRNKLIADLRLQGMTVKDIGKKVGLSHGAISNICLTQPEAKEVLSYGSEAMVAFVPVAVENIRAALNDPENKELKYKASQDVLKVVGIFPAHTQSVYIQTLNMTQQTIVSPEAVQMLVDIRDLRAHTPVSSGVIEGEVIDKDDK